MRERNTAAVDAEDAVGVQMVAVAASVGHEHYHAERSCLCHSHEDLRIVQNYCDCILTSPK